MSIIRTNARGRGWRSSTLSLVITALSISLMTGPSHAASVSSSSISPTVSSWAKTYDWLGGSEAHSVDRTSDGGFIVAGSTNETTTVLTGPPYYRSDSDGWLLKLDASGNVQWQKSYRTPTIDALYKVRQTSDGGFVAVGLTHGAILGDANAWVLRVDSQGNVLWQKAYGGGGMAVFDQPYSVVQLFDGGFVVAGSSPSAAAVLRLDASGNVIRSRGYGSGRFWQALASADGGVLLVGSTIQGALVVKFDPDSLIGPGCPIEGPFNSTMVASSAVPVSTSDTSFTTTAKVYPVNAVVRDSSASISVPCSYWLVTIAAGADSSTVRALDNVVLRVHASSENQALAGANVTFVSNGPGNFSMTTGLTDSKGNFTVQYGAPNVSSSRTIGISVTVSKPGYATTQKLVELTVNPVQKAPSVPGPISLWPYLAIGLVSAAALGWAAYFLATRKGSRNGLDTGVKLAGAPSTNRTVTP